MTGFNKQGYPYFYDKHLHPTGPVCEQDRRLEEGKMFKG
jgi:hypothetical protein